MVDTFLIPEQTVDKNGESAALDLDDDLGQKFLLTLQVRHVVEQESLQISVYGSEDGTKFETHLITLPLQFYTATKQFTLDLTAHPAIRFLKAKWDVTRWGRGRPEVSFTFSLAIEELLGQATA